MAKKSGKKSSHNTGKRGQRKHEKEQKRRKAMAQRRTATQRRTLALRLVGLEALADEYGCGLYETALMLAPPGEELPPVPPHVWTTAHLEAMETAEIEAKLAELGSRRAREELPLVAVPLGSAVHFAQAMWIPRVPATASVHDRDFVVLAACELWQRWRSEAVSQEMLLEPWLRGYESYNEDLDVRATRHWIRFWEGFQPALGDRVRTTQMADSLFWSADEPLFNWAMDLGTAGTIAANLDPELGRRVAAVLGEVVAQFAGEDEEWRHRLRVDQAEALYLSGAEEAAEQMLQALIAERPRDGDAYTRLADLWAPEWKDEPEALRRALALLEQATAAPVDSAEEWELEERMTELRKRLGS